MCYDSRHMDIHSDPISYPKIRLRDDKKEYELRFPLNVVIRLKKEQGIDVAQQSNLAGVDALERMLVMLSVGLAHSRAVTVDELAQQFDLRDVKWIGDLLGEALKPVSQAIAAANPIPDQPAAIQ